MGNPGLSLGIDFGTHKSTIAYVENNRAKTIPDEKGRTFMPSIVSITQDGKIHVGWDATELPPDQAFTAKTVRISSIKRLLGQSEETIWGSYRTYPQEISALILRKLKLQAEAYLHQTVKDVVIAVPAHFGINQRSATIQAAKIAGLNPARLINEANAAAMAYGLEREIDESVAVFDFGGGTFDVSILNIGDNVFEVISTSGKTQLGGVDIDLALANYIADESLQTHGLDLRNDPVAWRRTVEAAEKAKCDLTVALTATVELPYIATTQDGLQHLKTSISRQTLEEVAHDVFVGIEEACKDAIDKAKFFNISELKRVLLVGNSSHMPKAKEIAQSVFGMTPSMVLDPTEAVGHGAAVHAAILEGHNYPEMLLLDVLPKSLSIQTTGGVSAKLIEKNTVIPAFEYKVFSVELPANETKVKMVIYEGEKEFAKDNVFIGEIVLDGFSPNKKHEIELQIHIEADATAEVFLLSQPDNRGRLLKGGRPPPGRYAGMTLQAPYSLNEAQLTLYTRKVAAILQSGI